MNSIQSDVSFGKGAISSSTQFTVLQGRYFHGIFLQLKKEVFMKSLWLLSSMFSFFKQIREVFVFKGSAYILLETFFFFSCRGFQLDQLPELNC